MNRQENATLVDPPFVTLRFVFGNSKTNKCSNKSPGGATHSDASQCRHKGPCDEKRSNSRYRQCTNPR